MSCCCVPRQNYRLRGPTGARGPAGPTGPEGPAGILAGYVTPQDYGALANAVHDDTEAIQEAIDYAAANGMSVFFPPTINYYRTTAPITILTSQVTLRGASGLSVIINTSTTDVIQIGDGVTQVSDVRLTSLNIATSNNSPGWAIRARLAPNTTIDNCLVGGGNIASGAISLNSCWCSRITNNTIGNVRGRGIETVNSSNAVLISGNRLDGHSSVGLVGIYAVTRKSSIIGNTIENWVDGVMLGGSGINISSYFEANTNTSINAINTLSYGIHITGCYFADTPTAVAAIRIPLCSGVTITSNHSDNAYTSGAMIQVTAPYPDATYNIGQNIYADAAEVMTI